MVWTRRRNSGYDHGPQVQGYTTDGAMSALGRAEHTYQILCPEENSRDELTERNALGL
jgi:hypothetical protein